MKSKSWIITILSLTLLVLAVDYLFVHILFPHKKKIFLDNLFETPSYSITTSTLPSGLKTEYVPLEKVGSDNFNLALENCLSDPDLKSSSSPQALVHNLEKKFGIKKRVFTSETVHFINQQRSPSLKSEQRLLITALSTAEGVIREANLFKLNSNQLPVPVDLDPTLATNPTSEFLKNLLIDSTITYDEMKETIYFNSKTPLVIEWVNGEPKDFQMVGDQKTLSCQYLHCSCQ